MVNLCSDNTVPLTACYFEQPFSGDFLVKLQGDRTTDPQDASLNNLVTLSLTIAGVSLTITGALSEYRSVNDPPQSHLMLTPPMIPKPQDILYNHEDFTELIAKLLDDTALSLLTPTITQPVSGYFPNASGWDIILDLCQRHQYYPHWMHREQGLALYIRSASEWLYQAPPVTLVENQDLCTEARGIDDSGHLYWQATLAHPRVQAGDHFRLVTAKQKTVGLCFVLHLSITANNVLEVIKIHYCFVSHGVRLPASDYLPNKPAVAPSHSLLSNCVATLEGSHKVRIIPAQASGTSSVGLVTLSGAASSPSGESQLPKQGANLLVSYLSTAEQVVLGSVLEIASYDIAKQACYGNAVNYWCATDQGCTIYAKASWLATASQHMTLHSNHWEINTRDGCLVIDASLHCTFHCQHLWQMTNHTATLRLLGQGLHCQAPKLEFNTFC